ncbi:hypothetical protein DENSPDRAFT_837492 [Dentipellis sp. KUC8613]|nr:hypothetical protein DENSPDRAFT_837492 [Dentipellis sp. KUC8613]
MLTIRPQIVGRPSEVDVDVQMEVHELGDIQKALAPITELLASSDHPVRLHCTVPTWCPSVDYCSDLHDLQDIRSRALLLLHNLIKSLHARGVSATYRLTPSSTPLCLITASAPADSRERYQTCIHEALNRTQLNEREKVLLVRHDDGPVLVVT